MLQPSGAALLRLLGGGRHEGSVDAVLRQCLGHWGIVLGRSGCHFEGHLGLFEEFVGPEGSLGQSWGRSGADLGPCWPHLGAYWGRLGHVLGPPGTVLDCLRAVLGLSWDPQGPSWVGCLWVILANHTLLANIIGNNRFVQ